MAGEKKLVWDKTGEHFYETGVSNGILFVMRDTPNSSSSSATPGAYYYEDGVVWNGLISVSENPTGADPEAIYADNIKYLSLIGAENMEGTIECYTYPKAFAKCDGTAVVGTEGTAAFKMGQQNRSKFALCYTTTKGNDQTGKYAEVIHIVYGCYASPSEKSYETINDSPEAITFSYDYSSDPVTDTVNSKSYTTSIVTIDSSDFASGVEDAKYIAIKDKLYGKDSVNNSTLLYPSEIYTLIQ